MRKRRFKHLRPIHLAPDALVAYNDRKGKRSTISLCDVFNLSMNNPEFVRIGIVPTARPCRTQACQAARRSVTLPAIDRSVDPPPWKPARFVARTLEEVSLCRLRNYA